MTRRNTEEDKRKLRERTKSYVYRSPSDLFSLAFITTTAGSVRKTTSASLTIASLRFKPFAITATPSLKKTAGFDPVSSLHQ